MNSQKLKAHLFKTFIDQQILTNGRSDRTFIHKYFHSQKKQQQDREKHIKSCQIHSLKIQGSSTKRKIRKPKHIHDISRHSGVMMPKDGG